DDEIGAVVQHVKAISGQDHDGALAQTGGVVFYDNCASCHGDEGKGDQFQGAPNLTDAIWLYGGDEATLAETVTYSRFGVMPPWNERLSAAEVAAVSAYVHQLGGGQ
ncbi:MAG: cytochrome c oxidase cbb3-type subunit 3, partial [Dinoroseobacter sp.]